MIAVTLEELTHVVPAGPEARVVRNTSRSLEREPRSLWRGAAPALEDRFARGTIKRVVDFDGWKTRRIVTAASWRRSAFQGKSSLPLGVVVSRCLHPDHLLELTT